jgi:RNA recognition motif-containing protein
MSYLFVGNLSKNITEKSLHKLFSECGLCAVELKGPYAFVRYSSKEECQLAINRFNHTNLDGLNGNSESRVEFSTKNAIDDFLAGKFYLQNNLHDQRSINLDENENEHINKNNKHHRTEEKNRNNINNNLHRNNTNISQNNSRAKNICFICKLPGHFAKECVLTRDTCYECGIKGHMAKECQAGIRQAKSLNYNRVKAVFSQQSSFKYLSHKQKFKIYVNSIKNDIL